MVDQKQPVPGTKMVIWGDPKGVGEVFVVQSIKDALALWSLVNEKPGVLVISAPNPDELALLFQKYFKLELDYDEPNLLFLR